MSEEPDVQQWLLARGCPDHVIAAGTEGLLKQWERLAADCRTPYVGGLEDWLNDLDDRHMLFELALELPEAISEDFDARLAAADASLRECTRMLADCVWGDGLAEENGWSPEVEWWYWRAPLKMSTMLAEELGLDGPSLS
ncbi:MAG: hypothetical protein ABIU54_09245 [Candidatus Eisenbacteria bacterium]